MRWFLLAGALVLLAAPVVRAEDPNRAKEIAAAKKQVTDLEAQLLKDEADLKRGKAAALAIATTGQKLRVEALATIEKAKEAAEKTLVAPRAKVDKAKEAAEQAEKTAA